MRVQIALVVKKYYTGNIDGIMGNGTPGALMAFRWPYLKKTVKEPKR